MDQPLVSIIVPVYKVEKYLARCVESVLNQNYRNWELLLIDDGSPDNSGAMCDEWSEKDNRIRTFHMANEGVSSARNLGLDKAQGVYVMFLDSDDWYAKECVEKCVSEATQNDLDILQFNFYDAYPEGKILLGSNACSDVCTLNEYISVDKNNVGVCVWQGIYKRDVIENNNIRFDTRMKYAEDGVFVCTVLYYSKRIKHLEDYLYFYYRNPSSVMNKKNTDAYLDSLQIQIKFLDEHPIFQTMYRNLVTMIVGGLCSFDLNKAQRKRLENFWLSYRDNSPYVHVDEYHYSRSVELIFLPLQKISFSLAWFITALTVKLFWSFR